MPLHPDRTRLPIEDELLGEAASSLGRASEKLQKALAALAQFDRDAAGVPGAPDRSRERAQLRDEARQALWYVIVQREAMGIRTHDGVLRLLQVPREIAERMGPVPRRR